MEKEQLAEYLKRYHLGAAHAIASRELECMFSVGGKRLRGTVNRLRREGIPIASNGSGYFYADTEQEIHTTIAHMKHRISGIAAAIHGLTRVLEQFDTQQTTFSLNGGNDL